MFRWFVALGFALLAAIPAVDAQTALPPAGSQVLKPSQSAEAAPESAWLDLRQNSSAHSKVQDAPEWVESIAFVPAKATEGVPGKSVFRIRIKRPNEDCQLLMFRLYFDDLVDQQPDLVAWDESGTQILHSGPLGQKTGFATSSSTIVPMIGVTAIDVEVPGDGHSVRGAYLDWMRTSQVMRPMHAEQQKLMADPFDGPAALKTGDNDKEVFGTVTAPLTTELIPMGSSMAQGAAFQFGLEAQPLVALLTFEVASPQVEAPPEIYVNGKDVGTASLVLPDLADPGYRGLSLSLLDTMKFQYTGWVRAQKIVPASLLKAGTNDVIILAGAGTSASAIRETQIQLKYLWDKSDYLLEPLK
ncbi:MAG TPA: hypothetical protein VFJ88_00440 [Chthoniobacterales bacterium]|jgi:hypothetical protein|nr:hypothetical protein [Chthoniobacterales bacterium]